MKNCPTCKRTYTDESLSFCLDDGTPLVSAEHDQGYDPQATLFMADLPDLHTAQIEARTTADTQQQPPPQQPQTASSPFSQPSSNQQSSSSPFGSNIQQPSYQTPPPPPTWQPPPSASSHAGEPRKKGKLLPWVIAIIGLFVVGGLGLVIVLAVILQSSGNTNENNQNNENKIVINNNTKNTNNTNISNKNNNNGNTTNSNNSVDTSFITDDLVAANSETGASTTTFTPKNVIYYVFKLNDTPRNMTIVCRLMVDDAPPYKNISATSSDAEEKIAKGYSDKMWFKFTPAATGWPKGTYHMELLEKKPDGTYDELKRTDLTVE